MQVKVLDIFTAEDIAKMVFVADMQELYETVIKAKEEILKNKYGIEDIKVFCSNLFRQIKDCKEKGI